jgi:hypothetical protein
VIGIDFRHFEFSNLTEPKAIELTAHIRDSACAGEERFRWIAAQFQRRHLLEFLQMPDEQVIAEAKRRCRLRLGKGDPSDSTGRNPYQIAKDLDANRPYLPQFRVERAAFLTYCGRIHNGLKASSDDDWICAEASLRDAYKTAFR